MIKISEFRDNLYQIVRPNRFFVTFDTPLNAAWGIEELKTVSMLVYSAQLPARAIDTVNLKFHGMELPLMGDPVHEDLNISFINNSLWLSRDFFEEWMELGQQFTNGNKRLASNDMSNVSSVTVTQIGNTERDELAKYKFFNVVPKRVGEIELSMETENTAEFFPVTFAYSYWTQISVNDPTPPASQNTGIIDASQRKVAPETGSNYA